MNRHPGDWAHPDDPPPEPYLRVAALALVLVVALLTVAIAGLWACWVWLVS